MKKEINKLDYENWDEVHEIDLSISNFYRGDEIIEKAKDNVILYNMVRSYFIGGYRDWNKTLTDTLLKVIYDS